LTGPKPVRGSTISSPATSTSVKVKPKTEPSIPREDIRSRLDARQTTSDQKNERAGQAYRQSEIMQNRDNRASAPGKTRATPCQGASPLLSDTIASSRGRTSSAYPS